MSNVIYDDVGSFPIPKDTEKEWVDYALNEDQKNENLIVLLNNIFQQKIESGVHVPTYPQLRDMNEQFLSIIRNPENYEEPFNVKEEEAIIPEIDIIGKTCSEYKKTTGEELGIRVCITGPVELYLHEFGSTAYEDVLKQLAKSTNSFIKNSFKKAKDFKISTISIDEPSIGINPQIMFEDEHIIESLSIAGDYARKNDADVEIHLHSPLHYELACQSESINIIGVESAANPSYLELIDKSILESWDSYLRVGIARTDISNLGAYLNEMHNINVWKNPILLNEIVTDIETPKIISKRLKRAKLLFGDRVKYAGPDCGLGSWPSQEMARNLLYNVSRGIIDFEDI
ncbi:methionine synthase [Methanosalsum natronophilum]|uniref:Methionine synthase n=1 Tax=Methanosalsum natronophilum TaxID=768733 RepID=A0A3R7XEB8_9EURY|nr:methionine synthase [Methanosalsum natronophilum]MCS3923937.1 5-methyltetrahydropteroyltriglutamate--homocysteine methyltransferase [Methanosalsum natronophilum]RQD81046.1 MAG: methionine synthase [Methanosalsum natronophilum]